MKAYNRYVSTMRRKLYGNKSIKLHRLIVETILGKPLPKECEIHHVDGDRSNNTHSNLVVCPNKSYHQLLHRRQEVLEAGFDPNTYHKCTDCEEFKPLPEFSKNITRASGYNNLCKLCDNVRNKSRYNKRKGVC